MRAAKRAAKRTARRAAKGAEKAAASVAAAASHVVSAAGQAAASVAHAAEVAAEKASDRAQVPQLVAALREEDVQKLLSPLQRHGSEPSDAYLVSPPPHATASQVASSFVSPPLPLSHARSPARAARANV